MNKNFTKTLENPLIITLITILTVLALISLRQGYQRANLAKQNLQETKEKLAEKKRLIELKAAQLELAQEDLYKEKIIRNELLQQKEGELVLQIPLEKKDLIVKEELSEQQDQNPQQLNRQAWLELFY